VKAIDLVLRGCDTAGRLVLELGAVLTSPIVRDDRGSTLLFRCRAFEGSQPSVSEVSESEIQKVEVVMAAAGNMFSFRYWEIPGCILVLGKRCLCMVHLCIFVSFS
jgi:hypothetical protein